MVYKYLFLTLNMVLNGGAFTGLLDKGNPYSKGIDYDSYNLTSTVFDNEDPSKILTNYQENAKWLLRYLSLDPDNPDQTVLEIGSGTGITTIELLKKYPDVNVVCVEKSEVMLDLAKHKFNIYDGDSSVFDSVDNPELQEYWNKFKKESKKYAGRVTFLLGDIETIGLEERSMDAVVANQVIHWTNPSKTFKQLSNFQKPGSAFVWNTASHYYDDSKFPAFEYGFRFNYFLKRIIDEVGVDVADLKTFYRPKHDINSIQAISKEYGFDTQQVDTILIPISIQNIIRNQIYSLIKPLVKEEIGESELDTRVKEAIQKVIIEQGALDDTKHGYDIIPIFKSILKDTSY